MKGHKVSDDENIIFTANGWLEDQEQFFYNGMRTWRNPDQVHFSCRRICQKVTKYDVRISYLTVSVYELFERPSYIV